MTDPVARDRLAARDIYEAWAAAVDRQGRVLAPERRTWDLLPQQEKDLDADIAYQLNQTLLGAGVLPPGEPRERCPAARHHRVRRIRAGSRIIEWTEEGPMVEPDTLVSDACSACGHDFRGALAEHTGREAMTDTDRLAALLLDHWPDDLDTPRSGVAAFASRLLAAGVRPAPAAPGLREALDWEEYRRTRGWPTPNHMRRVAGALDTLTPAKYGEVLRWVADACDAALAETPGEPEPRPLSAEEEIEMRADLDPADAYQYGGWAHLVGRLFATLDKARSLAATLPPAAPGLREAALDAYNTMDAATRWAASQTGGVQTVEAAAHTAGTDIVVSDCYGPQWIDAQPSDPRGKHCFSCGMFYPRHFSVCEWVVVAPPLAAPGLDVERLARALDQVMPMTPEYHSVGSWLDAARMIAREYAAMAETPGEKP